MGRPAWANEDQWLWLSNQAAQYREIKGNKKETAKFWPVYLDGWKDQWPTPAFTDVIKETMIATSGAATEPDNAAMAEPDSAEVSTAASMATTKKKKAKEPLMVAKVCKIMTPLGTVS